jgi:hypothetical protein
MIDAYSTYQSGGTKATYDYDGTTTWYLAHFGTWKPLTLDYRISPPVIDARTREGGHVYLK